MWPFLAMVAQELITALISLRFLFLFSKPPRSWFGLDFWGRGESQMAQSMPFPIIQTGVDEKGWHTMDFEAGGGCPQIVRVNRWGRQLEIVLQEQPLRVHVNPTVGSLDEWEHPIGNKEYWLIGSPLEPQADKDPWMEEQAAKRAKRFATAGGEKESEETGPPAKKKQMLFSNLAR